MFGSVEAALLASENMQNAIVALDDVPDEPLVGPLVVIGPSTQQVGRRMLHGSARCHMSLCLHGMMYNFLFTMAGA